MFNPSLAQISFTVVLGRASGVKLCQIKHAELIAVVFPPVTIEQLKVTFTVKVNLISLGQFLNTGQ